MSARETCAAVAIAICGAILAVALWATPAALAKPPATTQAAEQVNQVLEKAMPEIQFDQVPFNDAVDFMRDIVGVSIFVDWRGLEKLGIDKDAHITLRLRNTPARKALELIARALSPDVGVTIEEGVVIIAPKAHPATAPAKR